MKGLRRSGNMRGKRDLEFFKEQKDVEKARKRVHGKGERKCVCESCGKGYFGQSKLKLHFEVVPEVKREWRCEKCRVGFESWNLLKRHLLIHSEERQWQCGIWGQRFRHKKVMERHVRGREE